MLALDAWARGVLETDKRPTAFGHFRIGESYCAVGKLLDAKDSSQWKKRNGEWFYGEWEMTVTPSVARFLGIEQPLLSAVSLLSDIGVDHVVIATIEDDDTTIEFYRDTKCTGAARAGDAFMKLWESKSRLLSPEGS